MSVAEPPSIIPSPLPDVPRHRPKIKKRRLLLIVVPLIGLALISTVFGMMMAVASDLPALESDKRFQNAKNSELLDDRGHQLGVLVNNQNLVYDTYDEISPTMRHAIIAVEDKRFYTNSGVDIRGIGRAFATDVFGGGGTQGGSTITMQFVKNALQQQSNRTVFEKLREAALAYHLTRKWSKNKILTEYLNTIYFGNGAYGIESAARVYFSKDILQESGVECGTKGKPACASLLHPEQAALLAGMVANPSGYDPQTHWKTAMARRNVVLKDMLDQGYLTQSDYDGAIGVTAPPVITPPSDVTTHPELNLGYYITWVRQQLVDKYGPKVFRQGWRIRTTLDLDLQKAAEDAVKAYFPPGNPNRPTAAMAVISNDTGEVRAMVGGLDYHDAPFNLATQGQRQPGSSFKPFVLAAALKKGISPNSLWTSKKKIFDVPGTHGKEKFVVNNFEGAYSGVSTLTRATTYSDNSVYADVGYHVGFRRISHIATAMGIRTPVSTNPAITLGGLKQGVSVLDMAHAYETLAHGGLRVEGSLGAPHGGPVGIREVDERHGDHFKVRDRNKTKLLRILSPQLASTETGVLETVITQGTGRNARIPGIFEAGKTGTTENYGDAWFVAYTDKYTVAVWVGYPDSIKSMKTDFGGAPVEGGTYPALIWHNFMVQAIAIDQQRAAEEAAKNGKTLTTTTPLPTTGTPVTPTGTTTTPSSTSTTGGGTPSSGTGTPAQTTPAAAPPPTGGGTSTTPSGTGGATPGGTGGAAPPPSGGTQTTG